MEFVKYDEFVVNGICVEVWLLDNRYSKRQYIKDVEDDAYKNRSGEGR